MHAVGEEPGIGGEPSEPVRGFSVFGPLAHVDVNTGVEFDTSMMFDVQVKRIHEYKRQLMNVMHVLHRYLELKKGIGLDRPARTVLIGGKAAPGYDIAKRIVHLVNAAGNLINNDPSIEGKAGSMQTKGSS